MFNVGGGEVIVILLIALIVLGPEKLPSTARQFGKYLHEFRQMSSAFQHEIHKAMDLPDTVTKPTTSLTKLWSPGGPTTNPYAADSTALRPTFFDPVDLEPIEGELGPLERPLSTDWLDELMTNSPAPPTPNGKDNADGIGRETAAPSIDLDVDGPSTSFS
jgi:Tat protein translocase TatB subunit